MDRFFEDTNWAEVLRGIASLGRDVAAFVGQHSLVMAGAAVAFVILWRWTMPSTR